MRLRNIPGAEEEMLTNPFVIREPESRRGRWQEVFGAPRPLHLEVGMGKGRFLTTLAQMHPDINYLGIEKMSSVLYRALQKREQMEADNLYFIRLDAEKLPEVFAPGEVDRLYLNFSDPWPKDRHHKRRLTSVEFLRRYEKILSGDAVLEFKTDNRDLFEFSLESVKEAGWELLLCTYDLHRSEFAADNVMTEYENRFAALGNKIMKLAAKPPVKTASEHETRVREFRLTEADRFRLFEEVSQ